ncbi:MAG: undecaprenyldiphospho-muramoylpentapeptide beta-N-acetylglucosaminyltransferase [Clostridia bacterium]|nr:undecaprenyldiphospho-muramoylpentapeptide beta-N-acetylglucosaminyltransferase [Clostridia bacterium]
MRYLLTGGGTAGHINPALAIADTIKANDAEAVIAYVGTPNGMENGLVGREGYKMYHVDVKGFRRSLSPKNIRAAWLALTSPFRAERIIDDFKPDFVIGTGGYVSWPVLVAAHRKKVPCAVHEANAVPGVTVARLEKYVDRVFLNFEETSKRLKCPEKHMHVGCPLRGGFSSKESNGDFTVPENTRAYVLCYGGSLGADRINDAMLEMFISADTRLSDAAFCLSTGDRNYVEFKTRYSEAGLCDNKNIEVLSYIYDMPARMAAADVVICRSGAITLSELALLGKCAILIPSPNVTNDQQYKNAKLLADKEAAVLIREKDLTAERLADEIAALICDSEKMERIRKNIRAFAVADSNKRIYNEMLRLIKKNKQ